MKRGGVGDVERAKRLTFDYDAKGITRFIEKRSHKTPPTLPFTP